MARTETWFDQDLKKPVSVRIMAGVQFSEDNQGSLIGVRVYDDGADATLTGGATGYCILADGQTITVDGTLEGNTAYILLPQSALLVPGPIQITIKLVDDGVITTLLACVGTVIRTKIGVPVVPGSVIEEWSEQISETLQDCVDGCQAAADAMGANLAAAYSTSATYPVGSYVIQSGTLYRCTTAVTTAGSWSTNSGKFTAVKLGNDVADLKSAVVEKDHAANSEIFQSQTYIVRPGLINASYNWHKSNDDMAHVSIPIFAGDTIEITANDSYEAQYAFLTDDTVAVGKAAQLIPERTRYAVSAGESATATAPAGSQYLYVLYSATGGQDRFPTTLKINGIDRLAPIIDRVLKAETLDKDFRNEIASESDLNNFNSPGNYYVVNIVTAKAIENMPIAQPGVLVVMTQKYGVNAVAIVQKYMTESAIYTRSYAVDKWSEWENNYIGEEFTQNPNDKYRRICNNFENKYYSGGQFFTINYRASMAIELNDGATVFFDKTKYDATYTVIDKTSLAMVVPNAGWNNSGKLIIDTKGIPNTETVVTLRDNQDASENHVRVMIRDVNKTVLIMNKTKEIDLFMFMGQSNMAGRGATNSTWTETYPTIIPCAGLEFRAITDKTRLYPMAEPFGKLENKSGGIDDGSSAPDGGNKTGGLAVAFTNEYYTRTGIPVVGVSASEGGTGIQSWITGTENLTDALQRLSDAVTYLTAENYTIRHKFMMWCQGESDTRLGVTGDQYKTYFDDIMTTMKTAGIEKCFLIRIGEFNGTTYDYSNIINAQTDIAQSRDDTVMATTILASYKAREMMKDQYHYYQAAYNEMGRYAGVNVAEYVNSGKEPTMYDPKNENLYYCHKN